MRLKMNSIVAGTLMTGLLFASISCSDARANSKGNEGSGSNVATKGRKASEESKKYWYDGTAEITSYELSQARYGEMRKGTAVLLFVTEPFSPSSNAKADQHRKDNVQVIKMNAMKKFNTGIYPYSLMTSTFFPFQGGDKSIKISFSMQEWCGMVYSEIRNKDGNLTIDVESYFEGEGFKGKNVNADFLEDDLWSLIRLNPEELPKGEQQLVPSMSFMRLKHVPMKSYKANLFTAVNKDNTTSLHIKYPELNRSLEIRFETSFPHAIVRWEETYNDGGKGLTTTATRIKKIKSDYWNRNGNVDSVLREELGLE